MELWKVFERLIYSHSVDLECSRVSEALDVVRHSDEFTPMSGRVDKYLPSYLFRFMLTMEYFQGEGILLSGKTGWCFVPDLKGNCSVACD